MEDAVLMALKYPTGKFKWPESYPEQDILQYIKAIKEFPALLENEVGGIDNKVLQYLHRPGGWTIRQIVHHCADSHLNAFVRCKLALTENVPTIKPYEEEQWSKLPDAIDAPVEWSLQIIEGMHKRWVYMIEAIGNKGWQRSVFHPAMKKEMKVVELLALYSWHGNHHIAQIKNAKKYKNQF